MKIAYVGNYVVDYTTEEHRAKSFEELGINVLRLQENKTTANQLLELLPEIDALFYSHTHGWEIDGLKDVFKEYKKAGIPTVSVHLDRWAGLRRAVDVGKEATWFTEFIFMADGSPEAAKLYNGLNLNWFYLPAGVFKAECYLAEPQREKYPHEVIITASKGYHEEYSYRGQLIDFLHKSYGNRFAHYGNDGIRVVRGKELNTLYASAKIVVGDSCFGGRPFYVSDRYYEVRGRGGFLIHPHVKGVDRAGVAHYDHPSLEDLKRKIDYFLNETGERETMRRLGFKFVRDNCTYTHRSATILDTVFG